MADGSWDIADPRTAYLDKNLRPVESEQGPANRDPLPEGLQPATPLLPPLELSPVQPRSLKDRTDLCLLQPGPLYELVRVPSDILKQFRQDTTYLAQVEDFQFNHAVLAGLRDWGRLLQAIHAEAATEFFRWALSQVFWIRDSGIWWKVRRQIVLIPDPVKVDNKGVIGPSDYLPMHVLLPYGNRGMSYAVSGGIGNPHYLVFKTGVLPPEGTAPVLQATVR